jgi:hypothetical protein
MMQGDEKHDLVEETVTTTQPTEEPEYVEHHTADENQTEPG